jgi:hypothetical protein
VLFAFCNLEGGVIKERPGNDDLVHPTAGFREQVLRMK